MAVDVSQSFQRSTVNELMKISVSA
jgi:hypothetical protein